MEHGHSTLLTDRDSDASVFEAAYTRLLPAMRALEGTAPSGFALDISLLAATVRGALVNLRTLREEIAKLPYTDVSCVDDLEDAARALLYANMVHQSATKPRVAIAELAERASALRAQLSTDVQALIGRGLVDDDALESYRGATGYRVLAMDLILLAGVLDKAWPAIVHNTAIRRAEITEANTLADALLAAVGERDQAPARIAEAQQMRQLAYALLLTRYDAARRAVTYLRWEEGDADAYAPSPYANRGNGNHKRRNADDAPSVPAPGPVLPKASAPLGDSPDDEPFSA